VQYGICVVSSSSHRPAAHAFVKRVLGRAGQKILVSYGFLPRVKPRP
jgi:ABC-type molybdate transport system substrate-binding protein